MKACKNCPFREGSPLGYDSDAMEALEDGIEPSCHSLVGVDRIMREIPGTRCEGYEAFCRGEPGYQSPNLVEEVAE